MVVDGVFKDTPAGVEEVIISQIVTDFWVDIPYKYLESSQRVFGVPDFKFYAMNDGIKSIFNRSPVKFGDAPREKVNPNQIGFGFT